MHLRVPQEWSRSYERSGFIALSLVGRARRGPTSQQFPVRILRVAPAGVLHVEHKARRCILGYLSDMDQPALVESP